MTYFVKDGDRIDSGAIRSNADILGSSNTLIFKEAGSYWLRVDGPLIGEQLAVLSDVTLKHGAVSNLFVDVAEMSTPALSLYQYHQVQGNGFFLIVSESSRYKDEVLDNQFVGYSNSSYFDKMLVGAGYNLSSSTNEFYIEVKGGPGAYDAVNDGRVLVTRGEISGKRDAAWGDWLDLDDQQSHLSAQAKELAGRISNQKSDDLNLEKDILDGLNKLKQLQDRLEINKNLLAAADETQSALTLDAIIKSSQLFLEISQKIMEAYFPASRLAPILKGLAMANGAGETAAAFGEAVNDPTLKNLGELNLGAAAYLKDAAPNTLKFGEIIGGASLVYNIYKLSETMSDRSRNGDDISSIKSFINDLDVRISNLQDNLVYLRNQQVQNELKKFSIQSTDSDISLKSESGVITVALSDDHLYDLSGLSGGKTISFSFQGDRQKAVVGSEKALIDGANSDHDTVQLPGLRESYFQTFGGGKDALFVSKTSHSGATPDAFAVLKDVERVQFSDGILALDVGSGENAGNAYRIYKAAFDRDPDAQGLAFWTKWLDDGKTDPWNMAARFIDSREFEELYGSRHPGNEDYLLRVYRNVLDRDPDQGGYEWWLSKLADGTFSQSEVLARFSDSPENRENVSPKIADGVFLSNEYFQF